MCGYSQHVKLIIWNMIRMLKNKGLQINDARSVLTCLNHLFAKFPYASQIFIELEGLDELEPWLNHQNQELREIA